MKKIVKLRESDLTRIISKTINEIRDNEGIDLICKSLKGKKNINIYCD